MKTPSGGLAVAAMGAGTIQIAERPPDHPDAARLIRAFYDEQIDRYGFADPAEMSPGEFVPPQGLFVVMYHGGVPAGCGGYRWFDRVVGTVEIKKTYVVPASRGLGAGWALLAWLERHAFAAGARQAILETGVRTRPLSRGGARAAFAGVTACN